MPVAFKNSTKVHYNVFLEANNDKVAAPVMPRPFSEIAEVGASLETKFKNKKAVWDAEASRPLSPPPAAGPSTWSQVAQAQLTPKDKLVSDLQAEGFKVTVADKSSSKSAVRGGKAPVSVTQDRTLPPFADPASSEFDEERAQELYDFWDDPDYLNFSGEVPDQDPPLPVPKKVPQMNAWLKSLVPKAGSPPKVATPLQSPLKKAVGAAAYVFKFISPKGSSKQPAPTFAKSAWDNKSPAAPPVVSPTTVSDVTKTDKDVTPLDLAVDVKTPNNKIELVKDTLVVMKTAEVDTVVAPKGKASSTGATSAPSSVSKVLVQEPAHAPIETKKAKKSTKGKKPSAVHSPPAFSEASAGTAKSTDTVADTTDVDGTAPTSNIAPPDTEKPVPASSVEDASTKTSAASKKGKKSKKAKKPSASSTTAIVSEAADTAAASSADVVLDNVKDDIVQDVPFAVDTDVATSAGQDTTAQDAPAKAVETASTPAGLNKNQRRYLMRKNKTRMQKQAAAEELKLREELEQREAAKAAEELKARKEAEELEARKDSEALKAAIYNVNFSEKVVKAIEKIIRKSVMKAEFPSDLRAAAKGFDQTEQVYKKMKGSFHSAVIPLCTFGMYPDMGTPVSDDCRLVFSGKGKVTQELDQLMRNANAQVKPFVDACYDFAYTQRCLIKLNINKATIALIPPQASTFNFGGSSALVIKLPVLGSTAAVETKTPQSIGWSDGTFPPAAETKQEIAEDQQPEIIDEQPEVAKEQQPEVTVDAPVATHDDDAEELISSASEQLEVPETSEPDQIPVIEKSEEPTVADVSEEISISDFESSATDADQGAFAVNDAIDTTAEKDITQQKIVAANLVSIVVIEKQIKLLTGSSAIDAHQDVVVENHAIDTNAETDTTQHSIVTTDLPTDEEVAVPAVETQIDVFDELPAPTGTTAQDTSAGPASTTGLTKQQKRNAKSANQRRKKAQAKRDAAVEQELRLAQAEELAKIQEIESRTADDFVDGVIEKLAKKARADGEKVNIAFFNLRDMKAAVNRADATQLCRGSAKANLRASLVTLFNAGVHFDVAAAEWNFTVAYKKTFGGLAKQHNDLMHQISTVEAVAFSKAWYDIAIQERFRKQLGPLATGSDFAVPAAVSSSGFDFAMPSAISSSSPPPSFKFGPSTNPFSTAVDQEATSTETIGWSSNFGGFSTAAPPQPDVAEEEPLLASIQIDTPEIVERERETPPAEKQTTADDSEDTLVSDSKLSATDTEQDVITTDDVTEPIAEKDAFQHPVVTRDTPAEEQEVVVAGETVILTLPIDKDTSKHATVVDEIDEEQTPILSDAIELKPDSCMAIMKYHDPLPLLKPSPFVAEAVSTIEWLVPSPLALQLPVKTAFSGPVLPFAVLKPILDVSTASQLSALLSLVTGSRANTTSPWYKVTANLAQVDIPASVAVLVDDAPSNVSSTSEETPIIEHQDTLVPEPVVDQDLEVLTSDDDLSSSIELSSQPPVHVAIEHATAADDQADALAQSLLSDSTEDVPPAQANEEMTAVLYRPARERRPRDGPRLNTNVGSANLGHLMMALPDRLATTHTRAELIAAWMLLSNRERAMDDLGRPHAWDLATMLRHKPLHHRIYLGLVNLTEFLQMIQFNQYGVANSEDIWNAWEDCADLEDEKRPLDDFISGDGIDGEDPETEE